VDFKGKGYVESVLWLCMVGTSGLYVGGRCTLSQSESTLTTAVAPGTRRQSRHEWL
jgi:hypothetical protein